MGYSVEFAESDVEQFNEETGFRLTVCSGWFAFESNGDLCDEDHGEACVQDDQYEWAQFILELQARVNMVHARERGYGR